MASLDIVRTTRKNGKWDKSYFPTECKLSATSSVDRWFCQRRGAGASCRRWRWRQAIVLYFPAHPRTFVRGESTIWCYLESLLGRNRSLQEDNFHSYWVTQDGTILAFPDSSFAIDQGTSPPRIDCLTKINTIVRVGDDDDDIRLSDEPSRNAQSRENNSHNRLIE